MLELADWSNGVFKAALPSREVPLPAYDPTTIVPIRLAAEEVDVILTKAEIAKTKKLRGQVEAMAPDNKPVELDIIEWGGLILAYA